MSIVVKLAGDWPEGVEGRMQDVVAEDIELRRDANAARGALSWGDIAALVQAGAAVITVLLTVWQIGQAARDRPGAASHDALNDSIRQQGIFGTEVVEVSGEGVADVRIAVRDKTSGEVFRFVARRSAAGISVSIERR